jgi:DNA topoisomerase IA
LVAVNKSKQFRGRGVELVKPGWRSVNSLSPFAAQQTDEEGKEVDGAGDAALTDVHEGDDEGVTNDGSVDASLCAIASKLQENDTLTCVLPAELKSEHTTPPPLLNEASLLYLMETAAKYVAKKGGRARTASNCLTSFASVPVLRWYCLHTRTRSL